MLSSHRDKHEDAALEMVTIYQAPQAKTMQFYVPLPVFAVECIVALLLLKMTGLWVFAILIPVHIWMIIKTAINPWWVEDMVCNWKYRIAVRNKGVNGKDVVTFSPHTNRREMLRDAKIDHREVAR